MNNRVLVICIFFLYGALAGVSTAGSLAGNGNGTVTDNGTHLTWQQDESSTMAWEAALIYCEGLSLAGSTDWRLPNHKEILSLVDFMKATSPTINTTLFPGAISWVYWSSTTIAGRASFAWAVDFDGGYSWEGDKGYPYNARCVRGGQ